MGSPPIAGGQDSPKWSNARSVTTWYGMMVEFRLWRNEAEENEPVAAIKPQAAVTAQESETQQDSETRQEADTPTPRTATQPPATPPAAPTRQAPDGIRAVGGPLRRMPMQERSAARVQRMLDACAELVDQVGYEGLTTTVLAERAGVAIGSVYQFFPDKRAVVQALTLRNLEAYISRIAARFAEGNLANWWDGVDAVIDEYTDMHRTTPGFRVLHFGDVVDPHLLDPVKDNNGVIASQLCDLLVTHFDLPPGRQLDFALTIAVETGDALIKLAFRRDPDGDPEVLREAKAIIRTHLSHVVAAPDAVSPAAPDSASA